jgi:hypothetical protein
MMPIWVKSIFLVMLSCIIGFASWGIATPYLELTDNKTNQKVSIYVYQQCVNEVCADTTSPLVSKYARSLLAIYITLIVFSLIAGTLMVLDMSRWRRKAFAVIVVLYAVTIMLIFASRRASPLELIPNTQSNYNLTASSISMIVLVCSTFWMIMSQFKTDSGFSLVFYDMISFILG